MLPLGIQLQNTVQKKFLVIEKADKETFLYCDAWFHWLNSSPASLYNAVHSSASQQADEAAEGKWCFPIVMRDCFPSSEPVYRMGCALTVHAMGRYSPDVVKNHAKHVLPLAFLGMHEVPDEEKGEKENSTLWTEVWQENVPGKLR